MDKYYVNCYLVINYSSTAEVCHLSFPHFGDLLRTLVLFVIELSELDNPEVENLGWNTPHERSY
jgi:hypothetical protein